MRKLCLIIPLFLIQNLLLAADGIDGCHITTGVTAQSRLYHTPYTSGSGSPSQWIETSEGHRGYNLITPDRCFNTTNIPCQVYIYGTSSSSPGLSDVQYSGFYAVVTTNCPIDDYVPAFFIFTALITAVRLRKSRHENINHYRCL